MGSKQQRSKSLDNIFGSESCRSVNAEIASVKRKIKLVEGIRRANYEQNEDELKKNELRIEDLRRQIVAKKKELEAARKANADFYGVIADHLKKDDTTKGNVYRGKSFEECTEILESLIGDEKNKLNLIRYKKREMKARLEALAKEERHLEEAIGGRNKNVQPMLVELRDAENSAALMEMRITEAENIQAKYKLMLETLKTENYSKSNSIRTIEQTTLVQRKEQVKLKEAVSEALKARKSARTKLVEVEEETLKEYKDREHKLLEARQELRTTRERMEEIGSQLSYPKFHMSHRDSSLTNGLYFFGSPKGMEPVKGESEVERVYNQLAELTGESDPATIVKRFEDQRTHAEELERTELELKSKVRKEKLRKRFLEDKLTQLQYSGGIKREMLDSQITDLNYSINATQTKKLESEKKIQQFREILEVSMKKLSKLCIRNEIPIPEVVGPMETVIGDRVNATLRMLYEKIESILLDGQENDILAYPTTEVIVQSPESDVLPSFSYGSSADLNLDPAPVIGLLGVRSRRTSISSMVGIDKDRLSPSDRAPRSRSVSRCRFSTDRDHVSVTSGMTGLTKRSESSDDNEETATRNSIKQRSQQIVEAKTRKGRYKVTSPTAPVVQRNPKTPGVAVQ